MKGHTAAQGLTLALNAAEGRLQLALGCVASLPAAETVAVKESAAKEAATEAATKETARGGRATQLYFAGEWAAQSQGAEILIPALQAALGQLKLEPTAIGRVAVVNGPGGFTGLRLALSSAAALSRALGATQAGLAYLPLLARNVQAVHGLRLDRVDAVDFVELAGVAGVAAKGEKSPAFGGPGSCAPGSCAPGSCASESGGACGTLAVLTHARSRLVYVQLFPLRPGTRGMEPISNLLALELKELPDFLRRAPGPFFLAGSGASRNRAALAALLAEAGLAASFASAYYDHVPPALLLEAALDLPDEAYGMADIEPLYLRASDAEEGLEDIARKLGHNPKESRARLNSLMHEAPDNAPENVPGNAPDNAPGKAPGNAHSRQSAGPPENPDA